MHSAMTTVKMIVFWAGLAWRHLRADPRRALGLAVRLAPAAVRRRIRIPPRPAEDLAALRRLRDADDADDRIDAARPASRRLTRHDGEQRHDRARHAPPPVVPDRRAAEPVRVLHLVTNALPHTQAGYTVRTHKIVTAQRAAGLDAQVVTALGYPLTKGIADARPVREVDGVPYHRLLPWLPPRDAVRKAADLAGRLIEEQRPTVLHAASNHLNAAVALELRERHGLPVVYEVRGFLEDSWLSRDPARTRDDEFYLLTRELETRRMLAADLVVTLGEAMREEILSRGVRDVLVVPNAVDDAFLEPLPDGRALKRELGFHDDDVVVGLTSTFYGFEGIDTLIEAAALIDARLLLVGDGPERAALERRAARLGVAAVFTGRVPVDQVRRYHAVLDVFAVPRTADRVCELVTPLKPLEAMAAGIPVIASDVRALREIIEPEMTGTLTLPEDPEAWAKCLADLIYSPKRRRRIGAAARTWIETERTWKTVTARYLDAYRKL